MKKPVNATVPTTVCAKTENASATQVSPVKNVSLPNARICATTMGFAIKTVDVTASQATKESRVLSYQCFTGK